ncbi:hypothetical protein LCGC14_2700430, partial [marine sediment metagenome]
DLEVAAERLTGKLTVALVIAGFRAMAFPKEGVNVSNADKNYALDKLGKLSGGYSETLLVGRGTDAQPTPVSAEETEMYREMARAAIKKRLTRGHTSPVEALHGSASGQTVPEGYQGLDEQESESETETV